MSNIHDYAMPFYQNVQTIPHILEHFGYAFQGHEDGCDIYRNCDGHECHCHTEKSHLERDPNYENPEVRGWMFHPHNPGGVHESDIHLIPEAPLDTELAGLLSMLHPGRESADSFDIGKTLKHHVFENEITERDDDKILPCSKCKFVGRVAADGRCPQCGEEMDEPRPIFPEEITPDNLVDHVLDGGDLDDILETKREGAEFGPALKVSGRAPMKREGNIIRVPTIVHDIPDDVIQHVDFRNPHLGLAAPGEDHPLARHIRAVTGGLSRPSKMPGMSYGLPAVHCLTGSKLRNVPGSVCEKCYAMRGMYRRFHVPAAQEGRYQSVMHALSGPEHAHRWVNAMATAIKLSTPKEDPHFRWHDSGDLRSPAHLGLIAQVATKTPHIEHWLPTKEHNMVRIYKEKHGDFPPNLTVRLSAKMRDDPPPNVNFHDLSSTVSTSSRPEHEGYHCTAYKTGGSCASCRECWSQKQKNIIYPYHVGKHHTDLE